MWSVADALCPKSWGRRGGDPLDAANPAIRRVCATDRADGCEPSAVSRASQGPANRRGSSRSRTASRPTNRTSTGREADRIKSTRTGWAAPTAAVTSFWRSGPLPLPLAAAAAGLWAALTGLVITVVVTLVVWIFAAGESASDTAMRVGADIWLTAHGVPFVVGEGVWTLLPWAWIVFPTLVLWAAGRWVAHRAAVAYPKSLAVAGACLGATYAAVALLAALFGTLSGAAAMPARAALHAAVLGFAVSVTAMAWRAQMGRQVFERAWHLVRPAVGALAVLTAGAGAVLAASLLFSHSTTSDALSQIGPGLFGGLALFLAWLGYLPAALMWALSYVTGAGVAVAGVTVTPWAPIDARVDLLGVQLLPTTEQPWWLVGTLIPIGAGIVLSRLAGSPTRRRDWILARAGAVAVVLIAVDLWWAISVGRFGAGRLELMGPPPVVIALLAAGVVLGVLLELAGTWGWRHWRDRKIIDLTDRQNIDDPDLDPDSEAAEHDADDKQDPDAQEAGSPERC